MSRASRGDRLTLALETSGRTGSVALLRGDELLGRRWLEPSQRSAQSLAPAMATLLDEVGCQPGDVALVAVTAGPGSFTGLRVGVTTAKVFAYAIGAEVIGVDTLAVVAQQAPREIDRLEVALDAQRNQVFAASFERDEQGCFTMLDATRVVDVDAWLGRLATGVAVSGPVLKKLASRLPDRVDIAPAQGWEPAAEGVARHALVRHAAGDRHDVWSLVPRYYRLSAAEEKLAAQQAPSREAPEANFER